MNRTMLLTLITAAAMAACTVFEPAPIIGNADNSPLYSIIDGDTVKTRIEKDFKEYKKNDPLSKDFIIVGDTVLTYKAPKLHTPPAKTPDLSKLKNNDDPDLKGKPLRMVAIGGSLTAGVRDGGYFNEGMLTSYPNLIARQMGIKFEQPLFDAQDYNGFGRKVKTNFNPTGGKVIKFKEASNNSGLKQNGSTYSFSKVNKQVDNIAVPGGRHISINEEASFLTDYSYLKDSQIKKLTDRLGQTDLGTIAINEKYDFLIVEFGQHELIDYVFTNKNFQFSTWVQFSPMDNWTNRIKSKKLKYGIMLNAPDVLDFPLFNQISYEDVTGKLLNDRIETNVGTIFKNKSLNNTEFLLLPSPTIDSISSVKVNIALKIGMNGTILKNKGNFLYGEKILEARNASLLLNKDIEGYAKKMGFSVVDLYSLYKKIKEGSFITDDGIRINTKNFFSLDGINPTALGQAVIANEVIKVINMTNKMEIPLIKTAEYNELK